MKSLINKQRYNLLKYKYDVNDIVSSMLYNSDAKKIANMEVPRYFFFKGQEFAASIVRKNYFCIDRLINYDLTESLNFSITHDNNYITVSLNNIPIYGSGEDIHEAIDMLKHEIEDLYKELNEDDNFSKYWLNVKDYLHSIIIDIDG